MHKPDMFKLALSMLVLISITFSGWAENEKYLIIVDDQYENNASFKDFVDYRDSIYDVTVTTLSAVGNSTSGIQNKIEEMYNGDGLKYVLLIGNSGYSGIPYFSGSYNTFHNYGLVDSDTYWDVYVGCFFVSSASDLENVIHKTMHTERNIDDYPKVTTQFTSYTTRPHIEKQCRKIKETYWDNSVYEPSWMIPPYSGGSSMQYVQDLKDQINGNGTSIVTYQAHGAENGWVNGGSYYSRANSIGVSDVRSFTNNEVYPVVLSFACVTGSFQKNGGFGEVWTTAEGGACAFIGSSKVSSYYQKGLNAAIASGYCNDELKTIGEIFGEAKRYMRDSSSYYQNLLDAGSFVLADEQMYNLFGDPGLHVKTKPDLKVSNINVANNAHKALSFMNIDNNKVTFNIATEGNYSVNILSLSGKVIANVATNQLFTAGQNSVQLTAPLANGMYLFSIAGMNQESTSKIAIIK